MIKFDSVQLNLEYSFFISHDKNFDAELFSKVLDEIIPILKHQQLKANFKTCDFFS